MSGGDTAAISPQFSGSAELISLTPWQNVLEMQFINIANGAQPPAPTDPTSAPPSAAFS